MTNIILAGAGPFVLPVFEALLASDITIKAVVTQPDAHRDRGKKMKAQEVAEVAEAADIPVLKPQDINAIVPELQSFDADLLLTASYGQFVKRTTRNAFPHKSYNLHPSKLPLFRGATPVNATLKEGHTRTAVTLYRMESKMDAGPIAKQIDVDVKPNETAGDMLIRLAHMAGSLAVDTLDTIVSGGITLQEQDHKLATECRKLSKQDAPIDWNMNAIDIHNKIRSQVPWPGSNCHFGDKRLSVFDTEVIVERSEAPIGSLTEVNKKFIAVNTGDGQIKIKALQLPGKKRLEMHAFLNGCQLKVGDLFNRS